MLRKKKEKNSAIKSEIDNESSMNPITKSLEKELGPTIEPIFIPDDGGNAEEIVEELNNAIEETPKNVEDIKSDDIYGGLSYEQMIAAFGKDKVDVYLAEATNIYGKMSRRYKNFSKTKKEHKIKKATNWLNEQEDVNKAIQDFFNEKITEGNKDLEEKIAKKTAWSDSQMERLSNFSSSRREWIKNTVEKINNIDSPAELEAEIGKFFKKKGQAVGSKIAGSKAAKKIKSKLDPDDEGIFVRKMRDKLKAAEPILEWYNLLMSIFNANISLDTVVTVVKGLIILQFYPFISKYNEYKAIVDDFQDMVLEMQVIMDALKKKADEYADEANVTIPPLPDIPNLPRLPKLPI